MKEEERIGRWLRPLLGLALAFWALPVTVVLPLPRFKVLTRSAADCKAVGLLPHRAYHFGAIWRSMACT